MRKASGATVALIMAIALYFTLFWGFDALRMLTSSTFGLEDVWRSQFVFGIGRMFDLAPASLIKLAAFFAVVKLTVAGVCGVHVLDRFRSLFGGAADSDILEAGLMLVVGVCIASAAPAIWSHNAELVRELVIQLLLAGIAAAACIVERTFTTETESTDIVEMTGPVPAKGAATVKDATWFNPLR
jgi:hypothetical protein